VANADGREVVVGVRAEDVHPASARPDLATVDGRIELVEALGSGLMAYFLIDAQQVRPEGADQPELADADDSDSAVVARPNLIANFPPRLDLRIGDTIPLAIDSAGLHFFDKETGAALR
jgi:multiple sugar transport system ATP-binding protein